MQGYFKDKFKSVQASFQRICEVKVSESSMFDASKDEYIRFFQDCFHLKDWLKNDGSLPKRCRNNVERFVDDSESLRICADIANASKHKLLKKEKFIRVDKNIDLIESGYVMMYDPTLTECGKCIRVKFNNILLDAFKLASECMREWEQYINKYKLFKITHKLRTYRNVIDF